MSWSGNGERQSHKPCRHSSLLTMTDDDVVSTGERSLRANISQLHKNLNHASPTVMAEMLKRRGAHDLIIRAARTHHCPICVQHSKHPPRQMAATQLHARMLCLEIDNFEWQHPGTRRKSPGTCIVCCFTHQPVIVIHETGEPIVEMANCSAKEGHPCLDPALASTIRTTKTGQTPSSCTSANREIHCLATW